MSPYIYQRRIIKKESFPAVKTACIMICKRRAEYIVHTSDTSLLLPSPPAAKERNEY